MTDRAAHRARGVLVITYFFPPVGGVGVQRTLKFVTHLPRWGWAPVVLAPRDPAYPLRDPSLLESVPPAVEVHRTLDLEPSRLVMGLRRRVPLDGGGPAAGAAPGTTAAAATSAPATVVTAAPGARPSGGPIRRLLRAGAAAWVGLWGRVLFPDEAVAWLPSAVLVGVRLARRRTVAVLYSSSPPVSTHLVAGLLRTLTRRPWVADFRDPWIGNRFASSSPPLGERLARRGERWVVARADRIVVAAEGIREQLVGRYPELEPKIVHIPNGFDSSDLVGLEPEPRDEPEAFRIVYAGSLYREPELEAFLRGVHDLLVRRPDLRARLRIEFVGRLNEANARLGQRWLDAGLRGVVRFHGFVPRRSALGWMASADALLQLMSSDPGGSTFVGGKLLEYLAFERPIVAFMPAGEGRRVVESLPGGLAADLEPVGVADVLERLVDDPPPAGLPEAARRFERSNLAGELAQVLDAAASR